jgi:hypothetical protein
LKTNLELAFKVIAPRGSLERRAWRLQKELTRRERADVDDIDIAVDAGECTVTVHLLVTASSEAQTLAKAMSVVVPAIYATGDAVDLGQLKGRPTRRSGVWRPDLELAAAAKG